MWDYVIVGGGTAGCVLANRLSAHSRNKVLLLEAGGSDWSPYIQAANGVHHLKGSTKYHWLFKTEGDPTRNGRWELVNCGKVLGGGSSINGTIYIRGQREDYDGWAALGNRGWSYDDLLPYFVKAEDTDMFSNAYHGRGGPQSVQRARSIHPLAKVFVTAAIECGIPDNPDYNGADQEGVGLAQSTIRNGWRRSTARAYLRSARRRSNLAVVTGAEVTRLRLEGKRAVGVDYVRRGREKSVDAAREVLLCAGTIKSPQLLLLSGIGPAEPLKRKGIEIVQDSPGVGGNLQDHPCVWIAVRVNQRTWNDELSVPRQAIAAVNLLLFGRGPAACGLAQAVAFAKSHAEARSANLEIELIPVGYDVTDAGVRLYDGSSVTIATNLSHPSGRGSVGLASADPFAAPVIHYRLLESDDDVQTLIRGCRLTRRIFQSRAFAPHVEGEIAPGPDVESDAEWESYLRAAAVNMCHPVGSCKMGTGPMAVVDERLRVRGVEGLRVVDASIMPSLPSGNTNAPTIMIAEKASDSILEDGAR
ncbi:MAG: GMC family oxidoreductase N-terminal domain-containing protein [Proteobacteria bacterium]|nr:GMC family oxidoreductase N-terminal domain-containing protein [Pseudomonadota bacterium]